MNNNEITFEEAVNALLENVQAEEASIEESDLSEDERSVTRVLLLGYKKALTDILAYCSGEPVNNDE